MPRLRGTGLAEPGYRVTSTNVFTPRSVTLTPNPGTSASHTIRRLPFAAGCRWRIALSVSGFLGFAIIAPLDVLDAGQHQDNNMPTLGGSQMPPLATSSDGEVPVNSTFVRRW